ncbi:MAG: YIP1 family protein [Bryobacterales bacterium]|nr:YIP1 family protein [Bryobacteraceae bacterium]MDW8355820.1 YIP1 family protein [Bryobacterales bacterium]
MASPEPAPRSLTEPQRLLGVFWEPKPVFADLAARPRWWAPLILMTALSVAYIVMFSRLVGWETFMRRQLETNEQIQQMPPEQREQVIGQSVQFAAGFGYAAAVLGVVVSILISSVVLLGIFNGLAGAELRFRQVFSIATYASLPGALGTVLAMIVMRFKNPEDFDLQNPVPLNLGAYLDPGTTPKFFYTAAGSLDLLSIWVILLLALGLSTAAKRVSYQRALALVMAPWAVYVLIKAGWSAAFG